jgi:hypothetical protein
MLTVITAGTNSIDDLDVAREEILSQLKDKTLLKNSVGMIACHYDYVEQDVVKAISEALPFDIIGCSTIGSAVNGSGSMEHLTLTVLTSDDVFFSTVMSDTISKDDFETPIEKAYAVAKDALGQPPAFIFAFGPVMGDVAGDQMLGKLNQVNGGLPVFGTLSCDSSPGCPQSYVFKNGESDRSKMALLLLGGNLHPRFYVTAIAQRNIQQNNAVVTGAEGYLVTSINEMPVLDYFATLGITTSKLASITMIPFLVDFGDGTEPVAYSMYDISEKGVYCGGAIPKGSKITFAEVDMSSVMETAEATLRKALDDAEKNGANGIVAIPCMARSLVLSPNVEAEIVKSLEIIGSKLPFMLIYSGGEICPLYNQQHGIINRFHNLTYTSVVF